MDKQRRMITIAVLLATFPAALDITIVGTAMPTIIGRLGGMALFSGVFDLPADLGGQHADFCRVIRNWNIVLGLVRNKPKGYHRYGDISYPFHKDYPQR